MVSRLAWLDTSTEDQRRMREIINMFTQRESRDELGIGQVRDALSDSLFPGTSTLHTRAKYLLFVPWAYQYAVSRGRTGKALEPEVARVERSLITALGHCSDNDGLIGGLVGKAVRILPSTIYWSALTTYGIYHGRDRADASTFTPLARSAAEEELVETSQSLWSTLPVPTGFPYEVPAGFALSSTEARFLQEHIVAQVGDTLLGHLVRDGGATTGTTGFPWEEPACHDAPDTVLDVLAHARLFSLAMHGAALLYNLLIAERYEAEQLTGVVDPVATYSTRLDAWADRCSMERGFDNWQIPAFWQLVRQANPRIGYITQQFVDQWLTIAMKSAGGARTNHARRLVTNRERVKKGAQSRLQNSRLLRAWSGASGSRQLSYRWSQVRQLVADIHHGLESGDAGA